MLLFGQIMLSQALHKIYLNENKNKYDPCGFLLIQMRRKFCLLVMSIYNEESLRGDVTSMK